MRHICLLAGTFLLLWVAAGCVDARVTRVEIATRQDVLDGKVFGKAGPYERITGRVYFSVPVANPHNARIVDLRNAENLRQGQVEFSAEFIAVRPKGSAATAGGGTSGNAVDAAGGSGGNSGTGAITGNGAVLLEVPNRGRPRIISLVDGGDWDLAHDAGDAWLLRNGYTIVSVGWQWDAAGADALKLYAPVAKEPGKTITGLVRGDVMLAHPAEEIPLGHLILGSIGGTEYAVSAPQDSRNTLTVRDSPDARPVAIDRSQWRFARTIDGKLEDSDRHIHLNGGFQPGKIYQYVYVAADPVIAGLGFAAIRDFASYLKHDPTALIHADRVYGEGISQNGRFLRDFLYEGFNADEAGAMALDGVLAHVAGAGRGSFNYRFAQPSRDAQPTSSLFFPTDLFPFTDLPEQDPITGERAGLLDRAAAQKVIPKIFLSNTSYEYWGRAAALIHVSADGTADAPISPNVRIYHFTGLQHFSGPFPPSRGEGDLLGRAAESPLPVRYFWRAMISNLDAWVRHGEAPPDSRYPKLADYTLVPFAKYAFPGIPGVERPHDVSAADRLDFGPHWREGVLSIQPPHVGKPFPLLVPQVDADGNELDGVRLPEISVPLATYTGWNLRDPAIGAGDQRVSFEGSYLPFPKTAVDRAKTGDPRKSIAERYSSSDDYLSRYGRAVDQLIRERWILAEDRDRLLKRATEEWAIAAN